MNYSTERIEKIMEGHYETLSNQDLSMMVIELVTRIKTLEDRMNGLEGELQCIAENHQPIQEEGLYGGLADDY